MRTTNILMAIGRTAMIGAIPAGAAVWLLTRPTFGVGAALATLFVGAVMCALNSRRPTAQPLPSHLHRRDPGYPSTWAIVGGLNRGL
jgi:hypothetical protein